jgi:hypothetical protein
MPARRVRTLVTICLATGALLLPASALGAPPTVTPVDEQGTFDGPLCGVDVHSEWYDRGHLVVRDIGPQGIDYYNFVLDDSGVVNTNPDTGLSIVFTRRYRNFDQRIVDNGDGTLTIRWRAIFNEVDRGTDGSVGFRSAGMDTGTVVVDHNGTPGDPEDDTVVSERFEGFVGHDRDDEAFCDWVVDNLT